MPRRKPKKTGNKQHSKGKKRPRGWHRRSKIPAAKLWRQIKEKAHPHHKDDADPPS